MDNLAIFLALIILVFVIVSIQRGKEERKWSESLRIDPAKAYYNKASSDYFKDEGGRDYEQALLDLNIAVEIDPEYADAYLSRGSLYDDYGEKELALEDYKKFLALTNYKTNAEMLAAYRRHNRHNRIVGDLPLVSDPIVVLKQSLKFGREIAQNRIWGLESIGKKEEPPKNSEFKDYEKKVVVTLSSRGFVQRVPAHLYAFQYRGGRGIKGFPTRDNDAVRLLSVSNIDDDLLFFTDKGRVFRIKCNEILAVNSRTFKGVKVTSIFPINDGERIIEILGLTEFTTGSCLLLATHLGKITRMTSDKFNIALSSSSIAIDLDNGDELIGARLATVMDDVMMVTQKGKSIRFPVDSLRASEINSGGVCGIRLSSDDKVIGLGVANPDDYLLAITIKGFGKLTSISHYPRQQRAGTGVTTLKITEKTGDLIAAKFTPLTQQVMIISANGIVHRSMAREIDPSRGIPIQGRDTQGKRIVKLDEDDTVVSLITFNVS
ncbi:DNA gyrase C-terminal beta-propeller domain-containing protein [Chloroflexota bacterium]